MQSDNSLNATVTLHIYLLWRKQIFYENNLSMSINSDEPREMFPFWTCEFNNFRVSGILSYNYSAGAETVHTY